MKIYLVGGAVRDSLLNQPVTERDWVVVGATVDDMLALNYRTVGKDFPVFLHPKTREEYALARTERKTGKGYRGFSFHASPDVTLEEDLKRRDLTINAIAQDEDGQLTDPFDGQADLKQKMLRHVSPAFAEDPVRILRIARFAARFGEFTIADETLDLMKTMVTNGEVDALVAERVYKELSRAIAQSYPERFFQTLDQCGALTVLFPQLDDLTKTLEQLNAAAKLSEQPSVRLATVLGDLDQSIIIALCKRYAIPNDVQQLALLASKHQQTLTNIIQMTSEPILTLLQSIDSIRRPERMTEWLKVCRALGCTAEQQQRLLAASEVIANIDITEIIAKQTNGPEIQQAIQRARITALDQAGFDQPATQ